MWQRKEGRRHLKQRLKRTERVHANKSGERERDQKLVLEQAREKWNNNDSSLQEWSLFKSQLADK